MIVSLARSVLTLLPAALRFVMARSKQEKPFTVKVSAPEPALIKMSPEMLRLFIDTLSLPFRNETVIPKTELKFTGFDEPLMVVPTPATWRTPGETWVIVMALLPLSPVMVRIRLAGLNAAV